MLLDGPTEVGKEMVFPSPQGCVMIGQKCSRIA